MENTEQDLLKEIEKLHREEWDLWDQIYRNGCHAGSVSVPNRQQIRYITPDFEGSSSKPAPRVLPKQENPALAKRERRMMGSLIETLNQAKKEELKLSQTDAYKRRAESFKKVEQKKEHVETEALRPQDEDQIADTMRRDLTARAIIDNKLQEKQMNLLFSRWSEHHKKLGNFFRTKAEPPMYYSFAKQLEEDPTSIEERRNLEFQEWFAARHSESSEYLKRIREENAGNIEKDFNSWLKERKKRTKPEA